MLGPFDREGILVAVAIFLLPFVIMVVFNWLLPLSARYDAPAEEG